MARAAPLLALALCAFAALLRPALAMSSLDRIVVRLDEQLRSKLEKHSNVTEPGAPLGRVLVFLSTDASKPPMRSSDDTQTTGQVFGLDYTRAHNGVLEVGATSVLGYPQRTLEAAMEVARESGSDEVFVQAKLLVYDQYKRKDGRSPVLPVSCVSPAGGDGMYGDVPGSLYSDVMRVPLRSVEAAQERRRLGHVAAADVSTMELVLEHVVSDEPSAAPRCAGGGRANSKWIRTVRMRSARLSEFWGRDIFVEACVLLPFGFDDPAHKDARYPLVVAHGHYSSEWNAGGRFREEPPSPDAKGYESVDQEYAYYLYRNWTMANDGPFHGARMLVITVNHPVPFFDDSYAVNSQSMGPYGDAIVYDLIPEVERQFRGIGEGWARAVFGGSTGGWESLATQVFYPDEFNGAYASCPDPISFTSFAQVNIYENKNAFVYNSGFKRTPIPAVRGYYDGQIFPVAFGKTSAYGRVSATMEEVNLRELVLGASARSCGQWDAWAAVFSPVDDKGYPKQLYNKRTGEIDREVAAFWRDNFDLLHIMKTNWSELGPKLVKKLHIFAGASDAFYLNNAVMDTQDFLESTKEPYFDGEVVIGQHDGRGYSHCFSGYTYDQNGNKLPNALAREMMNQRYLPRMAKHFAASAPDGADTTSWRY